MENTISLQDAFLIENVANTFGQAYFIFDPKESKFRYYNQALAHLFFPGSEHSRVTIEGVLGALHPEDRDFLYDQYAKLPVKASQKSLEFRIISPDKSTRWVCLSCKLAEQEGQELIVGYADDITKRKEYQNNILKFNSKKNATLEILSHDLAAPFANIQGMVELLIPELGPCEEVTRQLAQYIKENAMKGTDMIRDFVDNEFLESSQVVLHKERVNIVAKIKTMMDNYHQMGEALIAKKFELALPEKPIYMYIDGMKFMQVLNNLVSNAIKFTPDEGVISVAVGDKVDATLITVTDNGIGIPDDLKPQLFDKFTSSRRLGLRGEKSVGLGMSIIKNIVELHAGKIWFESKEGQGSTFYIEIPKE